ncbi:MAG: LuxR family transcriptional regulator [Paludibacter sp.]|nr:LuxR family transcriptional regulator [Paludibacter sp.]
MKSPSQLTPSLINAKFILIIIVLAITITGCVKESNEKILYATDTLLRERPAIALRLLDSIGLDNNFSHDEKMHFVWNKAKSLQVLGESLAEESLLPEAVDYYRKNGDKTKIVDSYLLMASYLYWTNKSNEVIATLDSGYKKAELWKDTTKMINFLNAKAEYFNSKRDYKNTVVTIKEVLKLSDKNNSSQYSHLLYTLGLYLSLSGDHSYEEYYKKSIDMVLNLGDTATACEYLRNYSGSLSGDHKYIESNDLLNKIKKLNPEIGSLSAIQMSMAENYLNLHKLDLARICLNNAAESEKKLQGKGYTDFARKGSLEMLKYLIDYNSGKMVSVAPFSRYLDSITNDMLKRNKLNLKQLEDKQQLQTINYQLHLERNRLWWYLVSLILAIILIGVGIYIYIHNHYVHLAEVEERKDVLTRLVEETANASKAETTQVPNSAFFKQILIKQLGIFKLMASTPTNQNQAMLKRIAAISEGKISMNELLSWSEIYPIIDSLYDNFYTYIKEKFGAEMTTKEINICCLLCANFSTKEIGILTQQSDATIYVRKTSIRKKINANEKQDIVVFLNDLRRI